MSTYRDELEAALAQSASLQQQNASLASTSERLSRENDALRRENDQLRRAAGFPAQRKSYGLLLGFVALMVALVAGGAMFFLTMRAPPPELPASSSGQPAPAPSYQPPVSGPTPQVSPYTVPTPTVAPTPTPPT